MEEELLKLEKEFARAIVKNDAEAITASTINAAHSLGRGHKIGSLEPGKLANFSIFDCEDYRELAYWFGFSQADSVYVRGERVCSGGPRPSAKN